MHLPTIQATLQRIPVTGGQEDYFTHFCVKSTNKLEAFNTTTSLDEHDNLKTYTNRMS